ncbi:DUF2075 domain-containing protein [Photobacterium indicum]|uniref:DUF2075 domain-containing protein n=1 Tax=Photobacterium indicum TaxID=81447 RepID=UPI003D0F08A8
MSNRSFYSSKIERFLNSSTEEIIGQLVKNHTQQLEHLQTSAWLTQIELLQSQLSKLKLPTGHIFFEFLIPRMGRRADVIVTLGGIVFIIEFKVGSNLYSKEDLRQCFGYALDLKNFHRGSHKKVIVPILLSTKAKNIPFDIEISEDLVVNPINSNGNNLTTLLEYISRYFAKTAFDPLEWASSGYLPTPTIIEAAQALYANHSVEDIARNEADTLNLGVTSKEILNIIHKAKKEKNKVICFVTGVPGAGKTLVGLNIANTHSNPKDDEYSVFLSGNGPLVTVLQEALAIDKSNRMKLTKAAARRETSQFIQNIHRFRDEALDGSVPPEKVAIFDEAQRAWNAEQTSKFMQTKRNQPNFNQSESDFLIEVMDRHQDWAVVIALIGGGQEINTGEAGLEGWLSTLNTRFAHWQVYCSEQLLNGEYISGKLTTENIEKLNKIDSLHLSTSMRSFRAEALSSFIHFVIAGRKKEALSLSHSLKDKFPLFITRDLKKAKQWLKSHSRATESCGLLASSNGIRLKAEGIFVKNKFDPVNWFLGSHDDIRSCHFLEDTATEFDVQGLELDWCLVGWDADYRYNGKYFEHWRFKGSKWQKRNKEEDQRYLENAYRVLLTRARQGIILYIPEGSIDDTTRPPEYYNETFNFLIECGFTEL